MQLLSLGDGNFFLARVYDEHGGRHLLHPRNTAHELIQLLNLKLEFCDLFLRQQIKRAICLHGAQLLEALNTALDGLEVGQHTAEPTGVDIWHLAAGRLLTDGILCLLLGADKEHLVAVGSELADKVIGLFELADRLLKVDDVDTVALCEDVTGHFGVPPAGLMAEVDACLKQLLHGYY